MITRPPLGAWVGMLASLVFVGALSLTPIVSSHDRPPGAAVSFWWARLAPFSYALHALRTTPVVTIVDDSLYCPDPERSEEHTSELQSHVNLVCRLLLEKKKY